jgi:hypothetical protein
MHIYASYVPANSPPPYSLRLWYKEPHHQENDDLPPTPKECDDVWNKKNSDAENSQVNLVLQIMLSDLEESENYTEYDSNYQQPSRHAVMRTRRLLQDSAYNIGHDIPLGTLLPDGNGGIRIEWIRHTRELSLMVPNAPGGREYLYHEEGSIYKAEYDVTSRLLAQWLEWLESGNPEEK